MSNTANCMLCNRTDFVQLPYFYIYQNKHLDILRCTSCGLGFIHPMLDEDEIFALYQIEYFEDDYHCKTSAGSYIEEISTMRTQFKPYLRLIKKYCPQGSFLELGCAGGATLAEARAQGFETTGVELSEEMAEWGRTNLQLDIRTGTLEQQHFQANSFDVVYLGDVIEHLLKPKTVLAEIHRILKPDGLIALAYPMELNHFIPRLRKLLNLRRQSPNKPYHLFYYTTKTLRQLVEQCGFQVVAEKAEKRCETNGLIIQALDRLNVLLTSATGLWGDRGFTVARSLKN